MIYGLLAEFTQPHDLVHAASAARRAGYTRFDAYAPYPVEHLEHAMGLKPSRLPRFVFLAGLAGLATAYLLQTWISVYDYPLNIGGRPDHSWPSFIPVMFEVTILFAAVFAVVGMLAANGLPEPHHPLFAVPRFDFASQSHFFLCIESRDPLFDSTETRKFLEKLAPAAIEEVEK
jgi:hypothetical protein